MKLFHNFLSGKSIRNKLVLYFISLLLFSMITFGIIGNLIYSDRIQSQTTSFTTDMISQVNKDVEIYINSLEKTMRYLSREPAILEFLSLSSMHAPNRVDCETEVRRIFRSLKDNHPEIAGMLIVNNSDIYISNEIYKVARDPLSFDRWYTLAAGNPGSIQLLSKPIGRNLATSLDYTPDDIVSIVFAVTDPVTNENLGVILIDMKLDTISRVISNIKPGLDGFIYISDAEGNLVYSPVNPVVNRISHKWLEGFRTGSIKREISGINYQIMFSRSQYTNWNTVGVFSMDEALKAVVNLRYYSFFIAIITLILAVIAALFFSSSIANPLIQLRKLMKSAEEGDFDVRFERAGSDEINQLGNSFNSMIDKIKKLLQMVYTEQQSKREAELKILQAQIKPHFLYNTLDTVQWMAQEHKADDIVEVVGALSTLFRIGLSKGKEMISVEDELEHIKSYMIIQKARYEDKIEYEINYEEEVTKYMVLKLILQPLVENAIYHGVKAKRGTGIIKIDAKKIEDKILFSIRDNGAGITPERLMEIESMLEGKNVAEGKPGYGIFNVNERIKLSFGPEYGLKFSSVPGEGTVVEVWHPIIER